MRDLNGVLVLGGAGFLGGHLCERLLSLGAQVTCVDDLSTSAAGAENLFRDHHRYRFVRHDVTQPLPAGLAQMDVDTIFALASPASPVDYYRLPLHTLRTGALGTWHALEVAERSGARLILASTSEVYGDPLQHPQSETYWGNVNPIGPRSVYDEAKRFAEALTFAYLREYSADVGVARIFNTYGPRMRPDDGRMVPTFCRQALAGEPLTVYGSGAQTRSVCFVDDTVAGLIALARSEFTGPVNLGNPDELTVLRIAELIRELTGSDAPIEHLPAPQDDPQRRCPDIETARTYLGWQPRVSYREGLATTVEWFRRHDTAVTSAALQ
ncbi:UDP-glucuronic acid decarboxylase family protein [Mycolicibacterium thermoresistibile]